MSKVNIIVLALVSLILANTLALGQGGKSPASARENVATSGERGIGLEQTTNLPMILLALPTLDFIAVRITIRTSKM